VIAIVVLTTRFISQRWENFNFEAACTKSFRSNFERPLQ
jgi:hypothetical protein